MISAIENVFRRYGTELILRRDGAEVTFHGFLHCVTSQSAQSARRELTVLGELPKGQYVLIAPAELQMQEGDTVAQTGNHYELRQVEAVPYRDKTLYQWGLCVKKGGEEA